MRHPDADRRAPAPRHRAVPLGAGAARGSPACRPPAGSGGTAGRAGRGSSLRRRRRQRCRAPRSLAADGARDGDRREPAPRPRPRGRQLRAVGRADRQGRHDAPCPCPRAGGPAGVTRGDASRVARLPHPQGLAPGPRRRRRRRSRHGHRPRRGPDGRSRVRRGPSVHVRHGGAVRAGRPGAAGLPRRVRPRARPRPRGSPRLLPGVRPAQVHPPGVDGPGRDDVVRASRRRLGEGVAWLRG